MQATLDELYRQLSDIPSPVRSVDSDIPHDTRRIADWVDGLPRANVRAVQVKLRDGLAALAGRSLDGTSRLAVLEQLRRPVHEAILQLEGQFTGASFPLAAAKVTAAEEAQALHHLLADGYRLAVVEMCAPSGKVPMLRGGSVAQAAVRAIEHYGGALREAWRVYRAPAPGNWLGLHRCAAYAEAARIDTRHVEDDLDGASATAAAAYMRCLIVATSNPYAYAQSTQDGLWSLARTYAEHCRLVPLLPGSGRPIVHARDDRPPDGRDTSGTAGLELDLSALINALATAMARQTGETIAVQVSRKETLSFSRETIERVRRTLKLATERVQPRIAGDHTLDTAIGLSGLHHHLAGGRGFDAFLRQAREQQIVVTDRAAWAHAGSEATGVRRVPARVIDQSLGGYRLYWGSDARARVGELVGLCLPGEAGAEDWMVGVIRWLRYESEGGITAGIELLARRARAVALVAARATDDARAPERALEVNLLDGVQGRGFVSTSRIADIADEVEILRIPPDEGAMPLTGGAASPARLRVVQNPGEYALLAARPPASESSHE